MMLIGAGSAFAQDDPGFDTLSDPFTDLTAEELADFEAGLVIFERQFGPTQGGFDPSKPIFDGGGPMRNSFGPNSCVGCHGMATDPSGAVNTTKDGGGHNAFRANQATAYDEVTGTCDHLEDRGGPGFQSNTLALPSFGFFGPTGKLAQEPGTPVRNPIPDVFAPFNGEYVPILSKDGIPVGPLDDRTTNDLFGLGLLDAITDQKLSTLEDPDDSNGDGISGRIHWVTDQDGELHAGKFRRKSADPHLDEFNAGAFQNEQGVTTPKFNEDGRLVTGYDVSDPTLPHGQGLMWVTLADGFPDEEVEKPDMDLLNAYVRFLAPPEQNPGAMSKKDRNQGSRIFRQTGCADCHTVQLTTGASEHDALNHKVIKPYSDLLLHDMGNDLAEGCKGDATPNEWRTEPLWGLRFVVAGYMHDGRAASVEEAILVHAGEGSEANNAVDAYEGLKQKDKDLLIAFLNTL